MTNAVSSGSTLQLFDKWDVDGFGDVCLALSSGRAYLD